MAFALYQGMASTEQLSGLLESLNSETTDELAELFEKDHDEWVNQVIELASKQNISATTEDIESFLDQLPDPETSVTIEQFEELRKSITPEIEKEITSLIMSDYDSGVGRIIEVASSKGVTIAEDEVDILIEQLNSQINEDNDEEDVELDEVALTAVAGGRFGKRGRIRAYRNRRRARARGRAMYRRAMRARRGRRR